MAKRAAKTTEKAPKPTTKEPLAQPAETDTPRVLVQPGYKSFRLQKRVKPVGPKLPGIFRLLRTAMGSLKRNWKLFLGILLIYSVLNIALVVGVGGAGDPTVAKTAFHQALQGHVGQFASGVETFLALVVNSSNTTGGSASGAYEFVLTTVVSLALIWTLREVYAGRKPRIRDAYYLGMQPLVPFVLVFINIVLQCIPFALGAYLYSTVNNSGIAASAVEHVLWAVLFCLMALWSLYMVSSSIMALYAVALPGMEPMQALRSLREITRYRRWAILRRVLLLPVALLLISGFIIIPAILFITPLAQFVFFAVTTVMVAVFHSYMYALYRSLL